jgi:hypothetical protein
MRHRIKSTALWVLLLSSAVVLALLVSVPIQYKIHAQEQLVRPYTIEYHGLAIGADGKAVPYDFLVASKSNGDSMTRNSLANSPRILNQVSAGLQVAVAPSSDKIMTMGKGQPIIPQRFGNNCEGIGGHTGEAQTILGFGTVKVVSQNQQKSPDGKDDLIQKQESWLAPDLNCLHLLQTTTWTYNGQPDGETTETATNAITGEPDPALFQVPANSAEVPPSVFYPAIGQTFVPKLETIYNKEKAIRDAAGLPALSR